MDMNRLFPSLWSRPIQKGAFGSEPLIKPAVFKWKVLGQSLFMPPATNHAQPVEAPVA